MSQRRQDTQDLSDVPDTLPEFLHAFFWDTNPKRVSPRRHMTKVAISEYHCELLDKLYRDWYCTEADSHLCHSAKKPRQEVLWTNYDPKEAIKCNQEIQEVSLRRFTSRIPLLVSMSW